MPPTFRISTFTYRSSSKSILNKIYTFEEIVSSVQTAVDLHDIIDYTDPISLEKAWRLVHILTSDSAWGVGMGSLVDEYLKTETRVFMRGLLKHTSEYLDIFSVANFMTRHFTNMKDPGFMRLLRAYLLAFPETFDTASTLMGLQNIYFRDVDSWTCYNPMVMTAMSFQVPASVLHTLLQAGVSTESRCTSGETVLMLTAKYVGRGNDEKMDLLLNYGACLDAFDCNFRNVFHSACCYCNIRTVEKLLAARKTRIQDSIDEGENLWDDVSVCECGYSCGGSFTDNESKSDSELSSEDDDGMEYEGGGGEGSEGVELDASEIEAKRVEQVKKDAAIEYGKRLQEQMILQDTFGYNNTEYATRLRNKHLLYVDPIQMRTIEDESLLMYASKRCLLWNPRGNKEHLEMLHALSHDGAPSEGIRKREKTLAYAGSYPDKAGSFLNYGMCLFLHTSEDDGILTFSIQKDGYNTKIYMDLEDLFLFIDVRRSTFPFHERPSPEDMECLFRSFKFGQQFDYISKDGFGSGEDFILDFAVIDYEEVDGHHSYRKTKTRLQDDSTNGIWNEHRGTIYMRFPKGPLSPHLFWGDNNFEDEDQIAVFHTGILRINKGLTFLQEVVSRNNREQRCFAFKGARELCNPLTTGEFGLTALLILEKTLQRNTCWTPTGHSSIAGLHRNDRGLLQKVRKDHDDILTHVFRDGLVGDKTSVLYNTQEQLDANRFNQRKAKTKARFTSPFHHLPDDVCARIVGFL